MFGWGRKGAVEKRAKLLARMVTLIVHGLQTQTYEQFVASFSNPGEEPDAVKRQTAFSNADFAELLVRCRGLLSAFRRSAPGSSFKAAATTSVCSSLARHMPA
jgi:hypothetical protein